MTFHLRSAIDGTEDAPPALTALGNEARSARDTIDLFDAPEGNQWVKLTCSEVSALCPVTSQPDLYTLVILYRGPFVIETKSLKLFLLQFRDIGIAAETLVDTVAQALFLQASAQYMEVTGKQQARGGIIIESCSVYSRTPQLETLTPDTESEGQEDREDEAKI